MGRNSLCFLILVFLWSSSLLSISENTLWVPCVFSTRKSVRDHRALLFPLPPPASLNGHGCSLWAKEPFLSVDIVPITVQWDQHLPSRESPTPLVRLSLQAALLSHCTSITAASMRLPYPPGSPATRLPSWVLQCLVAHVCVVETLYLCFMCVSTLCICPDILHETTCSGFVITALRTPENWRLNTRGVWTWG